MEQAEIKARIADFPRWHYQFDLGGVSTPIFKPEHVNRQRQRKGYFFDPLVELAGGSLRGKRVLDLGCNAGFWSLCAIEAGCDFVLGIDGREMHVEQSEFVFDVKGVDRSRYQFQVANVFDFDYSAIGRFDVVLCLGLLYHVAKPVSLFEHISSVNDDLLVVDTGISELPGSFLSLAQEEDLADDPRRAVDYRLVTYPTKMAVRDIAREFGYDVRVLKPVLDDTSGMQNYASGTFRAFMCAKKTDLNGLTAPTEPLTRSGQIRDAFRWSRNKLSEARRPHSRSRSTAS